MYGGPPVSANPWRGADGGGGADFISKNRKASTTPVMFSKQPHIL